MAHMHIVREGNVPPHPIFPFKAYHFGRQRQTLKGGAKRSLKDIAAALSLQIKPLPEVASGGFKKRASHSPRHNFGPDICDYEWSQLGKRHETFAHGLRVRAHKKLRSQPMQ
ncbi:hypothetical protein PAAG_07933 [Paracoccidioides lutzii Pb01]|uniref:Uncharacterized protein n=1 Tax=Paracoccidioides lutzii (strain ATCC MYA-826 / Pb01) TaxID=502779 RepID=C1HAV4_PARBA|nr:hypothetical protein PAAG_07933 [Paracoccidioides lutzii Pb01]EEH37515.2 hypothetical protein PAAG_07933 [Paracoccidioides lutzii Pb01]